MSPGHNHRGRPQGVKPGCGGAHLLEVGDLEPGEPSGFVEVGGDGGRERQQPFGQQPHPRRIQKIGPGTRTEHGIENHRGQLMGCQEISHHPNQLAGSEHADVHCPQLKVPGQFLEGFAHQIRLDRFHPPHSGTGLHRQGRDASHPVATMGGDGLYVRRNPGSR